MLYVMDLFISSMCKCAKSFSFWGISSPRTPAGTVPLDPIGGLPTPETPDWPAFILGLSGGLTCHPPKKFQKSPPKFDETEEPEAQIHGWMTLTKILVPICLYCLNCTKFGQLILGKIIKTVATRCQILRLKCTKFDFGWGSAPDPGQGGDGRGKERRAKRGDQSINQSEKD